MGDAQVGDHGVRAVEVDAVVHQEAVGKVAAADLQVAVVDVVGTYDEYAGTVDHVEGDVERLVDVADDVHVLTCREDADSVAVDGVGALLVYEEAVGLLGGGDADAALLHDVGQCQVAVVFGRQLQVVGGLSGIHDVGVVEAAVVVDVERQVYVVGKLAEDALQRVLQQVGHGRLEAAAQHGLHLCGEVGVQCHLVPHKEVCLAVAPIVVNH